MKQSEFIITENIEIAENVMKMKLLGDTSDITKSGQFVNIKIDGLYLRRPISVCNIEKASLTLIYKVVGEGTEILRNKKARETLDILTGLGNGYNTEISGDKPLLLGGGVGVPPLYYLARLLVAEGKKPMVIIGFNKASEVFFEEEFKALGIETVVTTADGSKGVRGFVTDAMKDVEYTHFYTCGPEPMLKAVYKAANTSGQFSFERRMGCGFGACMGCSCKTITGNKRICKEGPVMMKEDIIWED